MAKAGGFIERHGLWTGDQHRLAKALDTTPELWLNLQVQYDLWHARDTAVGRVRRLVPARRVG